MGGLCCTYKHPRSSLGNGHAAPVKGPAPGDSDDDGSATPVNGSRGSSFSNGSGSSTPREFTVPHDNDELYDDVFAEGCGAMGGAWGGVPEQQSERPRQLSEQQAKLVAAPLIPGDDQPLPGTSGFSDPAPDYEETPGAEDEVDAAPNAAQLRQNGDNTQDRNTDSAIYDELEDLAPLRKGSKKPAAGGRTSKHESGMSENEQIVLDFNEYLVSKILYYIRFMSISNIADIETMTSTVLQLVSSLV
jgi:hypothetical protein